MKRRSFLAFMVAAPAVIRLPGLLMLVKAQPIIMPLAWPDRPTGWYGGRAPAAQWVSWVSPPCDPADLPADWPVTYPPPMTNAQLAYLAQLDDTFAPAPVRLT